MKKAVILFITITSLLLSGCSGPSPREVHTAILITPTVFIISLGFQYLFFRLWKYKFPQITLSWLPNFIFYIFLVIIAGIFGDGNPFWFLTDEWGANGIAIIIFGSSFLTLLFITTRIWLFFSRTKSFTWISIITMSFYILPTFPIITGLTKEIPWNESIMGFWAFFIWVFPGSAFYVAYNFGFPGTCTVLVFFILLFEVWVKKIKGQTEISNE